MKRVNTSNENLFQEFKRAVMKVAGELKVKEEDVKIQSNFYGEGDFYYDANCMIDGHYFDYIAYKRSSEEAIEVEINISESTPPKDKMVRFSGKVVDFSTFERVTGAALHNYNIKEHPVNLGNLFGKVPIYIFNIPNDEIRPQIEVLLRGVTHGEHTQLEVYKFRHVNDAMNNYRFYSYVFKFYTKTGSLIVAFPYLGSLDSNGSYSCLKFADDNINYAVERGGIVKTHHYDIGYGQLENFLSRHGIMLINHLTPELEVNQMRLPHFDAFGTDFENEWKKFLKKFYKRNHRDALGDIRQIVQDAMTIICKKKAIPLPEESNRNPNTLVGKLIENNVLEGKFQEWTKAFTAFSNVGGHSRVEPTDTELYDPVFRKRIVLVIMLGVQLIEELQKFLKQDDNIY